MEMLLVSIYIYFIYKLVFCLKDLEVKFKKYKFIYIIVDFVRWFCVVFMDELFFIIYLRMFSL